MRRLLGGCGRIKWFQGGVENHVGLKRKCLLRGVNVISADEKLRQRDSVGNNPCYQSELYPEGKAIVFVEIIFFA
jgi:hypothetical protein